MRWPKVIEEVMIVLRGDAALTSALGGTHIYRAKSRTNIQIPAVFWSVVSDGVDENVEEVTVQFDIFSRGTEEGATIEGRLYALLHSDVIRTFGSLTTSSQHVGGLQLSREDDEILHRAVDYKFMPSRT